MIHYVATHAWLWFCSIVAGLLARMRYIALSALAWLLSACVTEVYDSKTGHLAARIGGDATNVTYIGLGYSFHVDRLSPSTTIRASSNFIGTAGASALPIATLFVK